MGFNVLNALNAFFTLGILGFSVYWGNLIGKRLMTGEPDASLRFAIKGVSFLTMFFTLLLLWHLR